MTDPQDRITTHPEYARSYQHYISQGSTPEEAARLAYDWTSQHVPPAPPVKKSRGGKVALLIAAGVIAVCGVGGVIAAVIADTGGDSGSSSGKPAAAGSTVRDGSFEFQLGHIECGVPQVGTEPLTKKAQGQFCLVTVTVANVKQKAETFDASSQKALGKGGAEYKPDSAAGLYANNNGETFLNDINPGNEVTGVLVFDIPASATLERIELHDSPFSGGAQVAVR